MKDVDELGPATARIADELNHQYTLGFTMTHPLDDRFHSLRVRVTRQQHRVRARRGYVALEPAAAGCSRIREGQSSSSIPSADLRLLERALGDRGRLAPQSSAFRLSRA